MGAMLPRLVQPAQVPAAMALKSLSLQFSQLIGGVLESVPVQSTYMHGQGLMVPVVGEITAVKGEDGLPSHLLLRAEERERAL